MPSAHTAQYYEENRQDRDRPALWFYQRLVRRFLGAGPTLDFGCGVGFFARRLSRFCATDGFEISEYAAEAARKRNPGMVIHRTLEEIPEGRYRSIISLHVLEHIDPSVLDKTLHQMIASLAPGGRLLLVMPNTAGRAKELKGEGWSAYSDPTHVNLKSAAEWEQIFLNTGRLRVLKVFADGYYDFPYHPGGFLGRIRDLSLLLRTLIQFLAARPLLDRNDGENCAFLLELTSEGG